MVLTAAEKWTSWRKRAEGEQRGLRRSDTLDGARRINSLLGGLGVEEGFPAREWQRKWPGNRCSGDWSCGNGQDWTI